METKNFLGLDGLNHFWEKAKVWIINEISTKISEIVLSSVPVGTVLSGLYKTVPNGFLLCDGTAYLRTEYPKLFAEISNIYNLPTDSADIFRVPDLRELVLVGAGYSNRTDIATHDVYNLGQFKDDHLQDHTHYCPRDSVGRNYTTSDGRVYKAITTNLTFGLVCNGDLDVWIPGIRTGRSSSTTHGKQFGVNYIIKY